MTLGFANGNLYSIYSEFEDRLDNIVLNYFNPPHTNAIELHFLKDYSKMHQVLEIDKERFNAFEYISIHAPGITYKQDNKSREVLNLLEKITNYLNIRNIVIHPNKVENWNVFKDYFHLPIAVENMDNRKNSYQYTKNFENLLEKYPIKITLDLLHCYTLDKSMKLADNFHRKFKGHIAEYHISGYPHQPLHITQENIILSSIQNPNLPIIIESNFRSRKGPELEMEYILKHIQQDKS
jgi:hypothetical protein